jgi:hypothetical protein
MYIKLLKNMASPQVMYLMLLVSGMLHEWQCGRVEVPLFESLWRDVFQYAQGL